MDIRLPDGTILNYWRASKVTFEDERWVLHDSEGRWIASIVPVPGLIVASYLPEVGGELEMESSRYSEAEQRQQKEIERLEKIIADNNLEDVKAKKRAKK